MQDQVEVSVISPTIPYVPVAVTESIEIPTSAGEVIARSDDFARIHHFFAAASNAQIFDGDGPSDPVILLWMTPATSILARIHDQHNIDSVRGFLREQGFREWSLKRLTGHSVRFPGFEWWVFTPSHLASNIIAVGNMSKHVEFYVLEFSGAVDHSTTVVIQGEPFDIQRINGFSLESPMIHECADGDIISVVHRDPALRSLINTGHVYAGGHPQAEDNVWHLRQGANFPRGAIFAIVRF